MMDKPKRKGKPKRKQRSYRFLQLVLLVAVIFLGIVIAVLLIPNPHYVELPNDLVVPADGDLFTPFCEFDTNPHMAVATSTGGFLVSIGNESVIPMPHTFNLSHWVEGSPYVWGTLYDGTDSSTIVVDLNTGDLHYTNDWTDYSYSYASPRLRYAYRSNVGQSNVKPRTVIYDGATGEVIYQIDDETPLPHWSPDEQYVLLRPQDSVDAQILNLVDQTVVEVQPPADATDIVRWIDDDTILYETRAGWLRGWNWRTGENIQYYDVRFEDYYMTDDIQRSPNFRGKPIRSSYMAGIESPNIFHLMDPETGDHINFEVDMLGGLNFFVTRHYVLFKYDDPAQPMSLFFPETELFVTVEPLNRNEFQISPDGLYIVYEPTDNKNRIIQSLTTGETFTIDTPENLSVDWYEIDGTSYLYHVVPVDGDAYVHYLLDPESRDNCKLGRITHHLFSFNLRTKHHDLY